MIDPLRGIAKTWSDQLYRLDPDTLRRLVGVGGVLVASDGQRVDDAADAAARLWLRPHDSILVVRSGGDDRDWLEVETELPQTIGRIRSLDELTSAVEQHLPTATDGGPVDCAPIACELRDLLVGAGWLLWDSDETGGWQVDLPDGLWADLLETAVARTVGS